MSTQAPERSEANLLVTAGAEMYRSRRGTLPWLILLCPIVIALPMLLVTTISADGWEEYRGLTLVAWGSLIPVFTALMVAVSVREDREAWLFLLASPVTRSRLVLGKFLTLASGSLASSLVLAAALLVAALATEHLTPGSALTAVGFMWVAWLGTLGIMTLLAVAFGSSVAMGVGMFGTLAGALTADKSIWFVNPFSWPLRAMIPFGHVKANGVPLPSGSPLTAHAPAYVAMGASIVVALICVALACLALHRKEI